MSALQYIQRHQPEWFRRWLIGRWAAAADWIDEFFVFDTPYTNNVDRLRWWLHELISPVFHFTYEGSDAELCDVWDAEIPIPHMTDRQFQHLLDHLPVEIECLDCAFFGQLVNHVSPFHCPECGNSSLYVVYGQHPASLNTPN